jgi:hypothetical protein
MYHMGERQQLLAMLDGHWVGCMCMGWCDLTSLLLLLLLLL